MILLTLEKYQTYDFCSVLHNLQLKEILRPGFKLRSDHLQSLSADTQQQGKEELSGQEAQWHKMTYISRSWLQIHAWTQLILHPQRQPSGRSSGQQDAPGTTVRKEGLPWTCSFFCFYPSPACQSPPLPFGTIHNPYSFSSLYPALS